MTVCDEVAQKMTIKARSAWERCTDANAVTLGSQPRVNLWVKGTEMLSKKYEKIVQINDEQSSDGEGKKKAEFVLAGPAAQGATATSKERKGKGGA